MWRGIKQFIELRKHYGSSWSWLTSGYNRGLRKFPNLLPFFGRTASVAINGEKENFYARLGSTDFLVLEEIFMHNEYALVADNITNQTRIIVDLGANVGVSIRYWQKNFPNCTIVGVEPHPENLKVCELNVRGLLNEGRCKLIRACIGSVARRSQITTDDGEWGHRLVKGEASSGDTVEVITMADVLRYIPDKALIDLIKCDIEGGEAELFSDCSGWINRVRVLVIEIHLPYSEGKLISDLVRCGASFRMISKMERKENPVITLENTLIVPE
jgi:FkbM family methyltransferase